MDRHRVIKRNNGLYYVQKEGWFGWRDWLWGEYGQASFATPEQARAAAERGVAKEEVVMEFVA
jgi:hypothetical protein